MRQKLHHILLVGGTGFVGEYLTRELYKKSANKLSIIYRSPLSHPPLPGVRYIQIDLTKSPMTSQMLLPPQIQTVVILTQPNALIMDNLLQMFKNMPTLQKLVYLSTILLYPDFPGKQDETAIAEPISSYEQGKLEEEKRLTEFTKARRLKLCIARLANVYGDVKNNGIIGRLFQSVFTDQVLVINGGGRQKRDYIFVEDASSLLKCLIEPGKPANQTEIYNLCTGEGYSIKDLIEFIEKITKRKINYTTGPAVLEKQIVIGDNQKILRLDNCKIKCDLIRGLKKTYANYQAKLA